MPHPHSALGTVSARSGAAEESTPPADMRMAHLRLPSLLEVAHHIHPRRRSRRASNTAPWQSPWTGC
eukprot:1161907-Pelagomonas_calceolata.AAC.8